MGAGAGTVIDTGAGTGTNTGTGTGISTGAGAGRAKSSKMQRALSTRIKLGVDLQQGVNGRDKASERISHLLDRPDRDRGDRDREGVGRNRETGGTELQPSFSNPSLSHSLLAPSFSGSVGGGPALVSTSASAACASSVPAPAPSSAPASGAPARYTIQYDAGGSSMLNIWTIDGNNPLAQAKHGNGNPGHGHPLHTNQTQEGPRTRKDSRDAQGSHTHPSHPPPLSPPRPSSAHSVASASSPIDPGVAALTLQLGALMRELEEERRKNQALREAGGN